MLLSTVNEWSPHFAEKPPAADDGNGSYKRPFCRSHTLVSLTTPEEARMESINHAAVHHVLWNEGKLVGQKAPLN
jgi:hypothetical protein